MRTPRIMRGPSDPATQVMVKALPLVPSSERRSFADLVLAVMKAAIAAKDAKRVLAVYHQLRENRFIGPLRVAAPNKTVMATCYAAQAAEVLCCRIDLPGMLPAGCPSPPPVDA